eukprot:TRINITY_DN3254_c0_g1_i2.p1 TRINITY_DN3254_c0_g1~~TRINITY_DN3254_c0_g1_i2.p1  ORF type:complete len:376 (-),score=89.51 TRINITY_DN3254_c0_g1_i2:93-1220(-)
MVKARMRIFLLLAFAFATASAHIAHHEAHHELSANQLQKKGNDGGSGESLTALRGAQPTGVSFLARLHEAATLEEVSELPSAKSACAYMIGFIVFTWFCSGILQHCVGDIATLACLWGGTLLIIVYMIWTGIFSDWIHGKDVGSACFLVCMWMVFQLTCAIILCACVCCIVRVAVSIKNANVKRMHDEYEEQKHKLSGPRRDYFESELFKKRCDELFDRADKDKNGSLDMIELQPIIYEELPESGVFPYFLREAFDENGDSRVEKDEFMHMMQYVSMLKFKGSDIDEQAAYEILQLDPNTATKKDVTDQYRILAKKYHPDHRHDVSDDVKNKDMQEINDAKAVLDKKLAAGGTPSVPVASKASGDQSPTSPALGN